MVQAGCAKCGTPIECWPYRVGKAVCGPCLLLVKAENGRRRGAQQTPTLDARRVVNMRGRKYAQRYRPDHPNAPKAGWVMEHRLVVEERDGRLLTRDEVVHHVDRNGLNNDPHNLVVETDKGAHLGEEHCMEGVAARLAAMPACRMGCGRFTQAGSDMCWPCWSASNTCPTCGRDERKMATRAMCHGCYKRARTARHAAPKSPA
jgi:hypothetical protein